MELATEIEMLPAAKQLFRYVDGETQYSNERSLPTSRLMNIEHTGTVRIYSVAGWLIGLC